MIKFQELKSHTDKLYLTIYYDQQNDWIYNKWEGYITPDNVKLGCLAILDAFAKFHTSYGLNDNKEVVGTWDQAVNWIDEEWTPRAIALGLRYFSHVVDKDAFAAASAADLLSRVEDKIYMRIFENVVDARQWLHDCKTVNRETY
ncbi:hypothetical protein ACSX1A_12910 [Pontibacter sp. MBLB2868]|uniref:hypothetical protein n=1 Tax=Pontibacter sp. MBLB2868 TaxID=3451555 RepID=UPI003F74C495